MKQIDYLVVGHFTLDMILTGFAIGGTVSFSGRVAAALGANTAVLTSTAANETGLTALSGLHVHSIPAAHTTTFENIYTSNGRQQILHAVAAPITRADLPESWKEPAIVHLAPVSNELDPLLINQFPNSFIGLTPQGWMRRWNEEGHVYAVEWSDAADILPRATAVVLSEEDLLNDTMLAQYRQLTRVLILTTGINGCTLFIDDEAYDIPAPVVNEVELTGAGDIFAAAFFMKCKETHGDYFQAARFANEIASLAVTQKALETKVARIRQYLQTLPETC
jgi:sugar/nucleoside kinase (ribokinase family)